jgi:diguanylate cyclase (GGDEF)-like protein
MYTKEQLIKNPYFAKILENEDLPRMLDSLTGVLTRPYIIGFIRYLIDRKIPFTAAMLDLDNFKFINDTYGHKVGDGVLQGVSNDMIGYLEDFGFIGRFGGDEFIIVNLRDLEYADKKAFYLNMYANFRVLRKNIKLENCDPFITGTIGSATYPTDADNYDELFQLMDKTLYRGKTKGRNCYIIYVEEKHKNIQIQELVKHGLYQTFYNISRKFDKGKDLMDKLWEMFSVLQEDLRISNLFYISEDEYVRDLMGRHDRVFVSDVSRILKDGMYITNNTEELKDTYIELYSYLKSNEFETVLIVSMSLQGQQMGYLMCAEPHTLRIWQEDECAILLFVAKLLAGYILGTGSRL